LVSEKEKGRLAKEARSMVKIKPHTDAICDIDKIGIAGYSPLEGLVYREDLQSAISRCRLANDLPWTIPIVVAPPERES